MNRVSTSQLEELGSQAGVGAAGPFRTSAPPLCALALVLGPPWRCQTCVGGSQMPPASGPGWERLATQDP